jgi:hypothetical protein
MRVSDPSEELGALFDELVGGRQRKAEKAAPIIAELDSLMKTFAARQRGVFLNFSVEVPKLAREIRFPYAFMNGEVNLVQPKRFGRDPRRALDAAIPLALEGDLLHKLPDTRHQLIVVSAEDGRKACANVERPLRDLFGEYHVRFFARRELRELERLVEGAH